MYKLTLLFSISIIFLAGFTVEINDEIKGNQRAFYECSNPIDRKLKRTNSHKLYFKINTKQNAKNLKSKNFHLVKNNPEGYFIARLINNSNSTVKARRQDGSLIMIQEALNENGEWQPIEYWVHSGCGNSYFHPLILKPGQYSIIPIKKYTGNFKTKIRLKLQIITTSTNTQNRVKNIYSKPFNGSIFKNQFKKETKMVNGILYNGPADYLGD